LFSPLVAGPGLRPSKKEERGRAMAKKKVKVGIRRAPTSGVDLAEWADREEAEWSQPGVFGAKLRALRRLRGLTLEELAERVETSPTLLEKIELGLSWPLPTEPELLALAKALEVDPSELVEATDFLKEFWKAVAESTRARAYLTWARIKNADRSRKAVITIKFPAEQIERYKNWEKMSGEKLISSLPDRLEVCLPYFWGLSRRKSWAGWGSEPMTAISFTVPEVVKEELQLVSCYLRQSMSELAERALSGWL
jgi:transcriptional regulator with XRE-family HTH domain